jgi:Spy/CpxP family protein refolding chaperone
MTDQNHPTPTADPQGHPQSNRKGGRRWFLVTATAVVAALTGAVASQALSQDGPPWRRGGMMGGPFHMGAPFDPARAEDRADRMVRHLAIEIDASAEQQDKLRAVAKGAVKDLVPMRQRVQTAREQARALLSGPTIDRAAIEKFRAEQIALADEASRRIAKALGDAAEVLTPEQRSKINDRIEWRRSHWRPWHRG